MRTLRKKPGQRLGRYELIAPVGRGGMAVVWSARLIAPRGFSKQVALKIMLPALASDPRFEAMFMAEARVTSKIKHPNVCEILDLGEDDGLLYLVIEWMDGDSLAAIMDALEVRVEGSETRRVIPLHVATRIVLDAARGLAAVHDVRDPSSGELVGIVHRDVSPQNILVTMDGLAKVADFGIAKIEGAPVTQPGFVKGKVRYMAPEQVYSEAVDPRTDVFSLGVVLYEATTGVHPFASPGANDLATLARIAAPEEAAEPRSIVADYPAPLSSIVMRAIAKDPDARFATMPELVAELEKMPLGTPADVTSCLRDTAQARASLRAASIDDAADDGDGDDDEKTAVASAKASSAGGGKERSRSLVIAVASVALLTLGGITFVRLSSCGPPTSQPAQTAEVLPKVLVTTQPPPTPLPDPPSSSVATLAITSSSEPTTNPTSRSATATTQRITHPSAATATASAPSSPTSSAAAAAAARRGAGVLDTRE